MRLAFIDPEPVSETGGGIRTYIRLAASLCRRHGWTVSIFSHNPEVYAGFAARRIERQTCLPRGVRGVAYRLAYGETVAFENARWLSQTLQMEKPDLVEFADFQGYAFFALRCRGLRSRITVRVHTPLYLVYAGTAHARGFRNWISFLVLRGRERNCLRRTRHLTAPSAEFMREKLPWLRTYATLPNPPPEPHPRSLSPRLDPGWTATPISGKILFLGRLEPRKGALELLKAFLLVAEELPHATLDFTGDTVDQRYQDQLTGLLATAPEAIRNRVHWLPAHRGDKSAFLQRYSCLVIPSLWENSPYVFWEGMAAGIPCLGSETGEMQRARKWTQAPGLPAGDIAALANALRQVLTSPDFCEKLLAKQTEYLRAVTAEAEKLPQYYSQCSKPTSPWD